MGELDGAKPEQPAAEATPDGGGNQKKQAKKRKTEKPSPEMIAYIQECRKRLRAQKETHGKERGDFVALLAELQQDALEERFDLLTWIERDPKLGAMAPKPS